MHQDEFSVYKCVCPICRESINRKISDWNFFCDECKYWSSNLNFDVENESDYFFSSERDVKNLISFLDYPRVKNYNLILDDLSRFFKDLNLNILDIGCASGLFLREAILRGHNAVGIEPNPILAKSSIDAGLTVYRGYFPDALPKNLLFDAIIFNDVLEHIRGVNEILEECKNSLNKGGIIIINIPNSDSLVFRASKILFVLGVKNPWDRLWQKMFHTPHLHYFNPLSLNLLMKRQNMAPCSAVKQIGTIAIKGLWERLSIDRSQRLLYKLVIYFGILMSYPLIRLIGMDSFYLFYRKDSNT